MVRCLITLLIYLNSSTGFSQEVIPFKLFQAETTYERGSNIHCITRIEPKFLYYIVHIDNSYQEFSCKIHFEGQDFESHPLKGSRSFLFKSVVKVKEKSKLKKKWEFSSKNESNNPRYTLPKSVSHKITESEDESKKLKAIRSNEIYQEDEIENSINQFCHQALLESQWVLCDGVPLIDYLDQEDIAIKINLTESY